MGQVCALLATACLMVMDIWPCALALTGSANHEFVGEACPHLKCRRCIAAKAITRFKVGWRLGSFTKHEDLIFNHSEDAKLAWSRENDPHTKISTATRPANVVSSAFEVTSRMNTNGTKIIAWAAAIRDRHG